MLRKKKDFGDLFPFDDILERSTGVVALFFSFVCSNAYTNIVAKTEDTDRPSRMRDIGILPFLIQY